MTEKCRSYIIFQDQKIKVIGDDTIPVLTIEISDQLMSRLKSMGQPVQDLIVNALERYIPPKHNPLTLTQTHTWQLCGTLVVSDSEPEYVIGQDEHGNAITNYAEHVDDILY